VIYEVEGECGEQKGKVKKREEKKRKRKIKYQKKQVNEKKKRPKDGKKEVIPENRGLKKRTHEGQDGKGCVFNVIFLPIHNEDHTYLLFSFDHKRCRMLYIM
jgi:hypothetical protein